MRIAVLERLQSGGGDIVNHLPLEKRSVPGFVAIDAFVDEPGIEPLAIGVEPDLAARSEGFQTSAAAAGNPWLGRRSGRNGPTDLKNIAHTVLVFRLEVHQAGGETSPSGHGMAMFCGTAEELRQQWLRWARCDNAKPVSGHHPMDANTHRTAVCRPDALGDLNETGIYDGKVEPLCTNALRV